MKVLALLFLVGCLEESEVQLELGVSVGVASCPPRLFMRSIDSDGYYTCIERWGSRTLNGRLLCDAGMHGELNYGGSKQAVCVPD